MKPTLIFMVGISGSGKSTIAKRLAKKYKAIIVSPDTIRKEITGNISDQSLNVEIWRLTKLRVIHLLKGNVNVILDATNIDSDLRRDFLKGLPNCDLKAKVIEIRPKIAFNRIVKDLEKGKDRSILTLDIIERQYEQFVKDKEKLEKEGFSLI